MLQIELHGKNPGEAIREVGEANNRLIANGQRGKVEIVHGYGSTGKGGVIRKKLRLWLAEQGLDFLCGELAGGNPGITILILGRSLPETALRGGVAGVSDSTVATSPISSSSHQFGPLQMRILECCTDAKPLTKIIGKCRRFGESLVCQAVETLVKQGLLRSTIKGKHKCYLTIPQSE